MTAYVTELCPSCGNLKSVCSDPNYTGYPQRSYCYASAGRDQTWRRTHAKYGHPEPKSGEPHETDGLTWWMSAYDLTPEDDFFAVKNALGVTQEPDGNEGESDQGEQDRA